MAIQGGLMVKSAPKVLIIDDELVICEDLSRILQDHGYQISGIATSGREAIQLAGENPPDLMLMDVKLQGDLNGIETTIVIQGELDRAIPTVFLTGFNVNEFPYLHVVDQCTYLNKPYTEEELISCIEAALKNPPLPS